MFAFKLCLALGRKDGNPFLMLHEMPEGVFRYWQAFYKLQPFGDERADLRIALMASAFCNTQGNKTHPRDFMPFTVAGEQTAEEQLAVARMIASASGAKPGA